MSTPESVLWEKKERAKHLEEMEPGKQEHHDEVLKGQKKVKKGSKRWKDKNAQADKKNDKVECLGVHKKTTAGGVVSRLSPPCQVAGCGTIAS